MDTKLQFFYSGDPRLFWKQGSVAMPAPQLMSGPAAVPTDHPMLYMSNVRAAHQISLQGLQITHFVENPPSKYELQKPSRRDLPQQPPYQHLLEQLCPRLVQQVPAQRQDFLELQKLVVHSQSPKTW